MQLTIRHAVAAMIIVATLLIVGTLSSLLQSDTPGGAASETCVAPTPARTLPPELEDIVSNPQCVTPEG
jgi:hypothetical protein